MQLVIQAGRPVRMEYTGLRPGEKLHERLLAEGEDDHRPVHPLMPRVPVPPLPWDLLLGHAEAGRHRQVARPAGALVPAPPGAPAGR